MPCTSSNENLFTCNISGPKLLYTVIELRFFMKKKKMKKIICENHVYLYFILASFPGSLLHARTIIPAYDL